MSKLERAKYLVLKDFEYTTPVGTGDVVLSYKKGDTFNLRVSGKIAFDLLSLECIKRLD